MRRWSAALPASRRQTVSADHILVSDGFAQDWLDGASVNHLRLGQCHADFGNTPRGLGALLAIAQHYDAIGFLDADNWFDEDHIEACVEAAARIPDADAVIARRRFVRYDGSVMNVPDEPDHVDTSCFWLCEGSLHLAHFWLMPVELAPICDRVFYAMIKARNLKLEHVLKPTVNFTCQYAALYRALGEAPPPGAKPNVDVRSICEWLTGLSERKRRLRGTAMRRRSRSDGTGSARPGQRCAAPARPRLRFAPAVRAGSTDIATMRHQGRRVRGLMAAPR